MTDVRSASEVTLWYLAIVKREMLPHMTLVSRGKRLIQSDLA
jgi:hypothetical protein